MIRAVTFLNFDEYSSKVFKHKVKKYKCRFCAKTYGWDALAIHERICYINAGKTEGIKSSSAKKHQINSQKDYLNLMRKIVTQAQEKHADRLNPYIDEAVKYRRKVCEEEGKEFLGEESIKPFIDNIRKLQTKEAIESAIKQEMDLITDYPNTLEPPTQDDNFFVMFKMFDKHIRHFSFVNGKVESKRLSLQKDHSRNVVKTSGFKVIQTPLSNRIFLIGGDDQPWSTFEYDSANHRFLPEYELKGGAELILPLGVGRSHHSLAATSGLIFCTGGHPDHLKRNEPGSETDNSLGRIVEVFKLKENMWIEYSNRLMNARYGHSSCIMGNFLYIFHGYDSSDSVLNCISVERLKVDVNEAKCYQDPGFNSTYVVRDDKCPRFTRCFTSLYTSHEGNKIIYFGYGGLEENCKTPGEQHHKIRHHECQKYQTYTLLDEWPKYHENKYPLEWETKEFNQRSEEIKVSKVTFRHKIYTGAYRMRDRRSKIGKRKRDP